MAINAKHGITKETPENILLGAGTYHRGLKWDSTKKAWDFGKIIGATSGGGKVSIAGEYLDIELDGALVLVKGLTVKQGGTASIEANMAEINADNITMATNFKKGTSDADGYDLFVDKADIEEGDYVENFAFVGKTAKGNKTIIVVFEYALCKEAFEIEAKNKENAVLKVKLDAYAENEGDLDTLPVKIYYPASAITFYVDSKGVYTTKAGSTWREFVNNGNFTGDTILAGVKIDAQNKVTGDNWEMCDLDENPVSADEVIVSGKKYVRVNL
jgi:hypothetical protein